MLKWFKELVEDITGAAIHWNGEGYFPYRGTVKLPEHILKFNKATHHFYL